MEKIRAIKVLKPLANSFVDYANITMKEEDDDTAEALEMAIDALKAQLSKEGTTSDMISRTETVEHLRGVIDVTVPITDYDSGFVDGVEFGISTVSTMPTIQSQSTAGQLNDGSRSTAQSTDLIDRQAAIDALDCINGVEEVLRSLPSVQPERAEGEWVLKDYLWECNKCGCRINVKNPLSYENKWSYFF